MVLFLIFVTVCGYHFFLALCAHSHPCTLYYSAEKAIFPSSLIESPVKLLALSKTQIFHFAENVSAPEK